MDREEQHGLYWALTASHREEMLTIDLHRQTISLQINQSTRLKKRVRNISAIFGTDPSPKLIVQARLKCAIICECELEDKMADFLGKHAVERARGLLLYLRARW